MESIYKASKAILLFLIIVLICQSAFGDKFTQNMSLVILFSMLILNSEKVVNTMTSITANLTANT